MLLVKLKKKSVDYAILAIQLSPCRECLPLKGMLSESPVFRHCLGCVVGPDSPALCFHSAFLWRCVTFGTAPLYLFRSWPQIALCAQSTTRTPRSRREADTYQPAAISTDNTETEMETKNEGVRLKLAVMWQLFWVLWKWRNSLDWRREGFESHCQRP